jgi:uncharacterized cupin superfamily protein
MSTFVLIALEPTFAVYPLSTLQSEAHAVDYDGDGTTDFAVWRQSSGFWYVIRSLDGSVAAQQWGAGYAPYNDVPVPGDYDGDGKSDVAVWRASDGIWYVIRSSDGTVAAQQWGAGYAPYNDVPVPGDYDGDRKTDVAVWRASDGIWYVIRSSDGIVAAQQWGASAAPHYDVPVPGDYDGDGKNDVAVWRASSGTWYVLRSSDGTVAAQQWGAGYAPYNDVPVPGDYDGDGKSDFAVWRASTGVWHVIRSSTGTAVSPQWGAGYAPYNDVPARIPAAAPRVCVPVLLSPDNDAVLDNGRSDRLDDVVWDFDWSDCSGATEYQLFVTHIGATIPIVDRDDLMQSSFTQVDPCAFILEENRFNWVWRVRAKTDGIWGAWSPERVFSVEAPDTDSASRITPCSSP